MSQKRSGADEFGSSARTGRISEQNFNTSLAGMLRTMHPDWKKNGCIRAEHNQVIEGKPNSRPDILVCQPDGVPVIIETEFEPAGSVEIDAKGRLGLKLENSISVIEQSIALKIPKNLAYAAQGKLLQAIQKSKFDFCVFSLNKDELDYPHRWPENGWITGNLESLADLVELSALSENNLNKGLETLERSIADASATLRRHYDRAESDILDQMAKCLNQRDSEQTTRMAMAIVLNAIMFHKSIIRLKNVKSFEQIWNPFGEKKYNKKELYEHWEYIVRNINYLPIFKIAMEIIQPLDDKGCKEILSVLFAAADKLEEFGATSRHDFCGRLFQRLITDRKFLATFYTLPSSAALLAEMVIDRLNVDWSKPAEIKSLKIADFACGTGALLNASLHSMISRHHRLGGDGSRIHKHLVEDVLVGADIMPAATHLTASIIAGLYPENRFRHTSIFTLKYGSSSERKVRSVSLGSLDLLDANPVFPALDTGDRKLTALEGKTSKTDVAQEIPDHSCDLVIMNPPFTNPTNHKGNTGDLEVPPVPAFAGLENSAADQKLMSERLGKLRDEDTVGSGQAGLASNFFDIAHRKVKCPNGLIALVLPFTFLRGKSWSGVRQCLENHYTDIAIFSIASSSNTERAFSADTGMAEVLLIARRVNNGGKQEIDFVNLVHRPRSIPESVLIAKKIIENPNAPFVSLGNDIVANKFSGDYGFSGVLHRNPAETAHRLSNGELILPQIEKPIPIPMASLGSLGRIGLLYRDITGHERKKDGSFRGPFEKIQPPASKFPTYPMLWGHDAAVETRLTVNPDSEARIRSDHNENAETAWNETKSRLHSNRDFQLNSQPLASCITERESIGGTAWPNVILDNSNWDIPVLLWTNTTLGLILFWFQGTRQQLGRVRMSNSLLPSLSVLDVRKLTDNQLDKAGKIFESFKNSEFLPANEAWHDPVRKRLDQCVMADLLGIDWKSVEKNLDLLRTQWCDEPSVHGGKSTRPM